MVILSYAMRWKNTQILTELNNVTDFLKEFLDNGSVNTFECATVEDVIHWTNVIARC
jgi:hypothetical protein